MLSAAFKIENSNEINIKLPPTEPSISFAGRISNKVEQIDNDCRLSVDLLEYNNFTFRNKEKMIFKLQVVFDVGPDSRFKKFSNRLNVGKLIFITGFLDLDGEEIFVEAKEIDLLDDFVGSIENQPNLKSPFSCTNKFKNHSVKKENLNDITELIKYNDISKKVQDDQVNISEKKRSYSHERESQISQKKIKSDDSDDEFEVKKHTNVTTRSQKLKDKLL